MQSKSRAGARRPRIGQWYLRPDEGELFQVVSFDDRLRTIDILTLGGELDEIHESTWTEMAPVPVQAPGDLSDASDGGECDDLDNLIGRSARVEGSAPQPLINGWEAWDDTTAEPPER